MFPTAHIAIAAFVNRAIWHDDRGRPTIVGALLPDVLDKPPAMLGLVHQDTKFAHSLVAAGCATAVAGAAGGWREARLLGTAYLTHLAADALLHGRVQWLYPLRRERARPVDERRAQIRALALEVPGALGVALWLRLRSRPSERGRRRRRTSRLVW